MLPINDIVNGTTEAASTYLAVRSLAVRHGMRSLAEKRAAAGSDVLSSIGENIKTNPILGKALLGGGLGAAVGAGHHMLAGEEDETGNKRKGGLLSKALTGGIAGTAIGGGLGAAQHFWPSPGASSGGGGQGGSGLFGGGSGGERGVFSTGGQRFKVDPQLIKDNPKLLEQVQHLSSSGPLYESLPAKAINFVMNNPIAPTTTPFLVPTAMADAALHNDWARLGQRNWLHPVGKPIEALGGLLNKGPGWLQRAGKAVTGAGQAVTGAGQRAANKGWFPGMIDPKLSRNPEHMMAGMAQGIKDNHPMLGEGSPNRAAAEAMLRNDNMKTTGSTTEKGHDLINRLAKDRDKGLDVQLQQEVEGPKRVKTLKSKVEDPTAKPPVKKTFEYVPEKRTVDVPHKITRDAANEFAGLGAGTFAEHNAKNPALKEHGASSRASVFRSGPLGGDRVLEGSPFRGSRALRRVGLYAGVPAAEWAMRSYARDVGKSKDLRTLLDEARAKGQIRQLEG